MAMVVKNNMSAVKTLNTLNRNSTALSKSLGKVSSGMKINSAADDASGYAISERMRVMVRSLDQADQNTQNGASMMKVAEGAVSSTVDILKTLKEKAINAANDSNTDADRAAIQKELDQSIDQIDDNALISYNGKTLVDGSKMAKGVATKTSLTNQSLSEDTTGATKLVELADRNGVGLNIQTTDTLTISYVIQGQTYSFDVDIDETTTLNSALSDAAEPYMRDSPAASAAYSTYDRSSTIAHSTYDWTAANASTTYQGVETNQLQLFRDKSTAYSTASTSYSDWVNGHDAQIAALMAIPGMGASEAEAAYQTILNSRATTSTNAYNDYDAASTIYENTTSTARYERDSTVADASTLLYETVSTAMSTLGDAVGELVPYKFPLDDTNVGSIVGRSASGDTVYTANRENAITITSGTVGLKYQISGLTFSVKDSKGQVKKSVNAVLDNFNESVRAVNKSNDNAITLQVGTKANQAIRIGLTDMRSESLGLKSSTGETISIATQKNANAAVNVLDNAIQKALDQQTDIGAVQARLEMTSANLVISSQNVQASESVIRDADMAKEMTEYTKNNVLLQAAQSMLAQANQSSSSVLSLLQ